MGNTLCVFNLFGGTFTDSRNSEQTFSFPA